MRDRLADAPEAEDADLAPAQRGGQRIGPLQPLAGAQIAVHLRQLAHGGDQQAQRQISHLAGEHVGRVRDDDAALRERGGVDVVVADAEAGDDLQPRKQLDEGGVDAGVSSADGNATHLKVGLAAHVEMLGDATFDERHGSSYGQQLDVLVQGLVLSVDACRKHRVLPQAPQARLAASLRWSTLSLARTGIVATHRSNA